MESAMPLTRREFNRALIATLAGGALPAAQAAAPAKAAAIELVEGREWAPISPPQPGDTPGKIEVLEFFSYGCPHCRDFNPLIERWATKLPKDVSLQRVPITFGRAAWANLSRLFYALEAGGQLARLDQTVFDALHVHKTDLFTEQAVLKWIAGKGVNANTFRDTMNSFAVETRLARAEALARNYKVNSVPMLTVDGRFTVISAGAKTYQDRLRIADALIERARQSKRGSRK
jgi:thiol:disulfide interchange protein DsbA